MLRPGEVVEEGDRVAYLRYTPGSNWPHEVHGHFAGMSGAEYCRVRLVDGSHRRVKLATIWKVTGRVR